jgi:hypothetical protein
MATSTWCFFLLGFVLGLKGKGTQVAVLGVYASSIFSVRLSYYFLKALVQPICPRDHGEVIVLKFSLLCSDAIIDRVCCRCIRMVLFLVSESTSGF